MNNHRTENLAQSKPIRYFLLVLTLLLLARQMWWAIFGTLNVDEFENLHIIWLYENGVMLYRDYYHSHLPVYNLLLYPIYVFFGPSAELPSITRMVLFPIVLLTIWQIGWIGYKVSGAGILGWLTVLFFLSPPSISSSLAEMRPDSVGFPLTLFAVMLYLNYTQSNTAKPSKFYLAGLSLGLSMLFSHKPFLLVLVLLWCFEQYHYRILKLPFGIRIRRLTVFASMTILPYITVTLLLLALGVLNLDNFIVVTTFRINKIVTDFFLWIKSTLLLVTPLFNLVVFTLGIIGFLKTKFWLGIKPDRSNAGLVFAGAYAAVGILQLLAVPVLTPHLFIFPFTFLCILAAWQLKRVSATTMVLIVAFAIIPANILDRDHYYEKREQQIEQFRFILNNIPPEVPVLDSMTGLSAFRFIINRHLYYRPGFFNEESYREYNQIVTRTLTEKRYGAVITDDLMVRAFPNEIKNLIEKNYQPSQFPNILLPRKSP